MKTTGYARVCTRDQSFAMQRQAFVEAGCGVVHTRESLGFAVSAQGPFGGAEGVQDGETLVVLVGTTRPLDGPCGC